MPSGRPNFVASSSIWKKNPQKNKQKITHDRMHSQHNRKSTINFSNALEQLGMKRGMRNISEHLPSPPPPNHDTPHRTGHNTKNSVPYYSFANSVCVLLHPTGLWTRKGCETRPTLFRPFPRRQESLTICRRHFKGSTSSSDYKTLRVGPAGVFVPAISDVVRRSSNWANWVRVKRLSQVTQCNDPARPCSWPLEHLPRAKWHQYFYMYLIINLPVVQVLLWEQEW